MNEEEFQARNAKLLDQHGLLISIYRKAKKALEAIALDSPNLYKFDELGELSKAVDAYETYREQEL